MTTLRSIPLFTQLLNTRQKGINSGKCRKTRPGKCGRKIRRDFLTVAVSDLFFYDLSPFSHLLI